MHQPTILLPLHAHTSRVLPVARMRLVHLVQRAESQSRRSIRDVFAQGPPNTLGACDASLATTTRPLGVDVDRVDARPSISAVLFV